MSGIVIVLAIVVVLAAGISIGCAYSNFKHMQERIIALEKGQSKRMPWKQAEAVEDFEAAAMYAIQAEEHLRLRLQHALRMGQIARNPDPKNVDK